MRIKDGTKKVKDDNLLIDNKLQGKTNIKSGGAKSSKSLKVSGIDRFTSHLISIGMVGCEVKSTRTDRVYVYQLRGHSPLVSVGGSVMRLRTFSEVEVQVNVNIRTGEFMWAYLGADYSSTSKSLGLHSKLVNIFGKHDKD